MKLPVVVFGILLIVALGVTARQRKCTKYDKNVRTVLSGSFGRFSYFYRLFKGPYCTHDKNQQTRIDDIDEFCRQKGFRSFVFGNGPNDDTAYCDVREDGGTGYRFNCCK